MRRCELTKARGRAHMMRRVRTAGDGKVSLEEFEAGLYPKTRAKIEEKLNLGWCTNDARLPPQYLVLPGRGDFGPRVADAMAACSLLTYSQEVRS